MLCSFITPLEHGCYFPRVATERDAKPRIENGRFVSSLIAATSEDKARVVAELPLPPVKFIGRFAPRYSIDYCGRDALEFDESSADDGRWTIRLAIEDVKS